MVPLVSASNDGVLPFDLLHDILLRLPARPLCRLRAVCRPWCALLSDPSFAAAHAARHPDPHIAVAVFGRLNENGRELLDFHLVDASSGDVVKRVCAGRSDPNHVSTTHGGDTAFLVDNRVCDRRLRVLDPASGEISLVPDHDHERPHHHRATIYSFTLGRTASMGGYKVVRIPMDIRRSQICSVLTLGGDLASWREAPSPPHIVSTWRRHVAVVDGVAYFVMPREFSLHTRGTDKDWIAAFDFDTEQWRPDLIGGPPEAIPERDCVTLVELRGSLVVAHDDHGAATLKLWFLLDDDGSKVVGGQGQRQQQQYWSKQYTITMPHHGKPWRWEWPSAEPVVVLHDGRVVLWVWPNSYDRSRGGVMRVYDPTTGRQTDVAAEANCAHVGVYTGSLLRLP